MRANTYGLINVLWRSEVPVREEAFGRSVESAVVQALGLMQYVNIECAGMTVSSRMEEERRPATNHGEVNFVLK
ncbi:hypothetical protein HAP94_19945 [Acidithiobacillus ferrivorans]|nr:hypothetical protein [Acidithiobacillus ferrivorans]